jgi:hypothetical protein
MEDFQNESDLDPDPQSTTHLTRRFILVAGISYGGLCASPYGSEPRTCLIFDIIAGGRRVVLP